MSLEGRIDGITNCPLHSVRMLNRERKKALTKTLLILGIVFCASALVYSGLAFSLGLSQPLMLVASNSMEPTISVGDIVVIGSASTARIHLGDVIVYQKSLSNFSVLHRVVCIVNSSSSSCVPPFYPYLSCYVPPCYYTKGDNNLAPDPWVVLSNDIRGVWTGVRIPFVGMSFICLQLAPACVFPWGEISIVALGSVIVFDLGIEYWLSRRSSKTESTFVNESDETRTTK